MVPTYSESIALWKTYSLPQRKQTHSRFVATLSLFLSSKLHEKKQISVKTHILLAAALLHDIDKNIFPKQGERHPDTAVRVLHQLGMHEVAQIVKTHPLHAICDPALCPETWEEKILFLSDKMVKDTIISVDQRFILWKAEQLPEEEMAVLETAYPKVKALETEVLSLIAMTSEEVIIAGKNCILTEEGVLV